MDEHVLGAELRADPERASERASSVSHWGCWPEVFVRDVLDVHAKELFGSVLVDVLQEAFRASTLVPDQGRVAGVPHPAAQETVTVIAVAKAKLYKRRCSGVIEKNGHYWHRR